MKTDFELEATMSHPTRIEKTSNLIRIIGQAPKNAPYVVIEISHLTSMFIQDKDLERFAVNILKTLKSKHLKTSKP